MVCEPGSISEGKHRPQATQQQRSGAGLRNAQQQLSNWSQQAAEDAAQ